jgi:hypothetical protein
VLGSAQQNQGSVSFGTKRLDRLAGGGSGWPIAS